MDSQQFREFGKAMVDYIANYSDTIRDRKVLASVEPGYLSKLIPNEAPRVGEKWQDVLLDVERVIMPGVTHWHSPNFHAYCPTANSFPAVVGEMLSAGIGCVGFNWEASPACTELEVLVMNWLGKLLNLPEAFLHYSDRFGGGVIQGSASESTLVALLTAKAKMVKIIKEKHPHLTEHDIKGKLVAYTSDQANSSVEKAGILGSMNMRLLAADNECVLRGEALKKAIENDRKKGLIPCLLVATLGTTGTCAFDNLEELGPICNEENLWLHIDAAYAGSAFACPEYHHYMKGVKYADSFNFNPHKWLLVNSDCSALWVRDSRHLVDTFAVERIYLKHKHEGIMPDYRHWQISLGRRFRALKLWFVMRIYGVEGIQKHIRSQIGLANYFEELVKKDGRFEVCTKNLGLVCFRIQGENILTENLLQLLTERKNIYCIPCFFREKYVIRFVVCSRLTVREDIDFAWNEICQQTEQVLKMEKNNLLLQPPFKKKKIEEDVLNNNLNVEVED